MTELDRTLFLSKTGLYSVVIFVVCRPHAVYPSSLGGHLGCLHLWLLGIMLPQTLVDTTWLRRQFQFSRVRMPWGSSRLLGHLVILWFAFGGTAELVSTAAASFLYSDYQFRRVPTSLPPHQQVLFSVVENNSPNNNSYIIAILVSMTGFGFAFPCWMKWNTFSDAYWSFVDLLGEMSFQVLCPFLNCVTCPFVRGRF